MEAVFINTNLHIECDATSEWLLSRSRSFIAFIPKGVEALPSPKKLLVIFKLIALKVSFFLISGKINFVTGERNLLIFKLNPLFSRIFKIPLQKHIPPHSLIIKLTAFIPPLANASEKFCKLFVNTEKRKPIPRRTAKIMLSIKSPLYLY